MKNGGLKTNLVEEKLREFHGNMAAVGRFFGVTRQSVWRFCQARESLKAVSADCRESMKDNAESSLYSAVLRGEAWAVCFYLKTQARDRGYIERTEMDMGDRPLLVRLVRDADFYHNADRLLAARNGTPADGPPA